MDLVAPEEGEEIPETPAFFHKVVARQLPRDIVAERCVIDILVRDPQKLEESGLTSGSFSLTTHQKIVMAIEALNDRKETPTIRAIAREMGTNSKELVRETYLGTPVRYLSAYGQRVREAEIARNVYFKGMSLVAAAFSGDLGDIQKALDKVRTFDPLTEKMRLTIRRQETREEGIPPLRRWYDKMMERSALLQPAGVSLNSGTIESDGRHLIFDFPFEKEKNEIVKTISGIRWEKTAKKWLVSLKEAAENAMDVTRTIDRLVVAVSPVALRDVMKAVMDHRIAKLRRDVQAYLREPSLDADAVRKKIRADVTDLVHLGLGANPTPERRQEAEERIYERVGLGGRR